MTLNLGFSDYFLVVKFNVLDKDIEHLLCVKHMMLTLNFHVNSDFISESPVQAIKTDAWITLQSFGTGELNKSDFLLFFSFRLIFGGV